MSLPNNRFFCWIKTVFSVVLCSSSVAFAQAQTVAPAGEGPVISSPIATNEGTDANDKFIALEARLERLEAQIADLKEEVRRSLANAQTPSNVSEKILQPRKRNDDRQSVNCFYREVSQYIPDQEDFIFVKENFDEAFLRLFKLVDDYKEKYQL